MCQTAVAGSPDLSRRDSQWDMQRTTGGWGSGLLGVLIFSGSLYLYSFTGIKLFGAITPFGGLLLMTGWLALVVRLGKRPA